MEDKKFNTFTFCQEDYKEYSRDLGCEVVNEYALYEDVKAFIRVAVQNGYQCRVWHDGLTIVIEYNYLDESMSGVSLQWIGENEYIETYQKEDKECELS